MIEWSRWMVGKKRLHWCQPLFRFDADDPKKSRVIHVGGLYGAFGEKDLGGDQLAEMKKHGIYQRDAWQESALAKLSYLFAVVNLSKPEDGVQLAVEAQSLGNAVKKVIRDAMSSDDLGPQKGNPFVSPYPIRWTYHDDPKLAYAMKYEARKLSGTVPESVLKLITGPKPSLSSVLDPFNKDLMRAAMERHCVVKGVPWDAIFAPPKGGDEEEPEAGRESSSPEIQTEPKTQKDDELVACDGCEKAMKASDSECPHCGMKYDVAAEPDPPPPPKALPKRSAAAKAAPPPPPSVPEWGDGGCGEGDDEIPF
jgi:hypothetical protein